MTQIGETHKTERPIKIDKLRSYYFQPNYRDIPEEQWYQDWKGQKGVGTHNINFLLSIKGCYKNVQHFKDILYSFLKI